MTKPVFLYRITNRATGQLYIGSSVNPKSRFAVYRCKCHNSYLRRAFQKYGIGNFDFETIACVLRPSERDAAETQCIAAYRACDPAFGYNQLHGGRSSAWSEARKAAIKGRPSPNKGKTQSLDARQRISDAQRGKVVSLETRQKLSASVKKSRATKFWRSHSGKVTRSGPFKPESIEKMRVAARLSWIRRKANTNKNDETLVAA